MFELNPVWIGALIGGANLLVTIGGIGFAWGTLAGRLKTLEIGQEAIWSEVVQIKKALGLVDAQPGKFVERMELDSVKQRMDDDRLRLNAHSERLREIEVRIAGQQ